ncbi:MAG TPA: lysophospholipid acyltransferase family protein, partial [Thermoleophilia bacterium]|nr:lysophospholipid acyltransferase family protein [Thermoleophilia bacterium]
PGVFRLPRALGGLPVYVPEDPWFYKVARVVLPTTLAQLFHLRASGTEHLPPQGPAIIVINHQSEFDPPFIGVAFQRPLRYMAKSELFGHPWFRWLIEHLGAFPIYRGEGDREALRRSLEVLAAGQVLLMFPEGTRFTDGRVHEFLPGVGLIALRSGAPVIPAAMKSTELIRGDGRLPRLSRVRLIAGPPVALDDLEGRGSRVYEKASRRMMEAVSDLYDRLP